MRTAATLLALLTATFPACANVLPIITDVRVESVVDSIVVTYTVNDADGDVMAVSLRFAGVDGGFDAPAAGVSGDFGHGITSGEDKRIVISPLRLAASLPDPFLPRILAHDGTGFGAEMIRVESESGVDFLVDRYEVTNEQFAEFVNSDGYEIMECWLIDDGSIEVIETGWNYAGRFLWRAPRYWDPDANPPWSTDPQSGLASTPVLGLSWFEAYAYCRWAGRRLPTSGEWREAAGIDERGYPWGDTRTGAERPPLFGLANLKFGYADYSFGDFTNDGHEYAAPVGSHSPEGDSPLGIADAVGNVWEWCSDVVAVVDYGTFSCATRPLKGGSWATAMSELEHPTKDLCPLYRTETLGFRCFR